MVCLTARPPSRSTSSPPKHLIPLTPASTRKNRSKRSQPPLAADEHSKQSAVRTNQQREMWIRSPSPALGPPAGQQRSWDRSVSPGTGSLDQRSRAGGRRSPSPAVGSLGQRSVAAGQRSSTADGEGDSAVFTRRSSSLSNVQRRTTTRVQQTYVTCFLLIYCQIYYYNMSYFGTFN